MSDTRAPEFIWLLFTQLRNRRFPVGPDDYEALRQALKAGFGWSSREALRDLCCSLWAKSKPDREIVQALFDQIEAPEWELPQAEALRSAVQSTDEHAEPKQESEEQPPKPSPSPSLEPAPATQVQGGLPPVSLGDIELPHYHFVLVPQFPLSYREVAQAWRRIRRPVREGMPVELDVEATIARRCRTGVVSDLVLAPRRRNTARLVLLVDRNGSMAPFHDFVRELCIAVEHSGHLGNVQTWYFHDVPVQGADKSILRGLPDELFPSLDAVLTEIKPFAEGQLYSDPGFHSSRALQQVLETQTRGAAVVLLSDAGAARRTYDVFRLLDTVAFLKALRYYTHRYVWLNPMLRDRWTGNTAAQIARHVPMFPLDRTGIYQAVNVLRGQPYQLERPI